MTNFDGPTLTFTIESDLNTDQGPYVIELTGEYIDGTTASITFNLELVPCVITVVPLDDQTHDIYSGSDDYVFTAFTLSGGHCPTPTYSAIDTTNS